MKEFDPIDPIDNVRRAEDVNQDFDQLRAEAKRRQRIYEGIPDKLTTQMRGKDGDMVEMPYGIGARKQPLAEEAEKRWGRPADYVIPDDEFLFTINEKDKADLGRELADLDRDCELLKKSETARFDEDE